MTEPAADSSTTRPPSGEGAPTLPADADDVTYPPLSQAEVDLALAHLRRDTRGAAIMRAEAWHEPLGRVLREIVFGMNDGLISQLGFVAGVSGAMDQTGPIIAAGLAAMVSGTISMTIGGFVSVKSQREFYESEISREVQEMATMPEHEREEVRQLYRAKGFRGAELERIVSHITSNRDVWLKVMMEEELGLFPEHDIKPAASAAYVGVSFALGSVVPLLPYFFLPPTMALIVAVCLAAATLFGTGAAKARLTRRHWLVSGAEIMAFGLLAAAIGYAIGTLVGELVPGVGPIG